MPVGSEQIAGWKTAEQWKEARRSLRVGDAAASWAQVFQDFYVTRLELRYLKPISVLQTHGTLRGEGFAILALQCTLIEFLESTVQGVRYVYPQRNQKLAPFEYSSSKGIFVSFLSTRTPFATCFDNALARDFYTGVRCALLHEARTRDSWRVWASSGKSRIVDGARKIVYRDGFQAGLRAFIEWYGNELVKQPTLQEAFIRKFDDLCC